MEVTVLKLKVDHRPPRLGWADGNYQCRCFSCQRGFIGDKRAVSCADCAYDTYAPETLILDAAEAIDALLVFSHQFSQQPLIREIGVLERLRGYLKTKTLK